MGHACSREGHQGLGYHPAGPALRRLAQLLYRGGGAENIYINAHFLMPREVKGHGGRCRMIGTIYSGKQVGSTPA